MQDTDFLVIGAGIAGLRAAIELAPAGRVLVLAKSELTESATQYAQGGIAVALSDEDEISLHLHDTIAAGDGLGVLAVYLEASDIRVDDVRGRAVQGDTPLERLIEPGMHVTLVELQIVRHLGERSLRGVAAVAEGPSSILPLSCGPRPAAYAARRSLAATALAANFAHKRCCLLRGAWARSIAIRRIQALPPEMVWQWPSAAASN